jgi:hypothetical protein
MANYYLCYRGKKLGEQMSLDMAESMLIQMGSCFRGLEILEAPAKAAPAEQPPLQASDRKELPAKTGTYSNLA